MRYIYKISYEKSATEARQQFKSRFDFETTVKLPFKIKPYKSREELQLYYVPTVTIESLLVDIYQFDKKIENQFHGLPSIAKANFILDVQIEELQNTNEIEGVRSTKKELNIVKSKMKEDPKVKLRFTSLINSYDKLLSGELTEIVNAKDIRKIYDYLVLDEIDKSDMPDGEIFTKEATQVTKKSGSGKVIHEGLANEKSMIDYMDSMIGFMDEEDIPLLIKIAIFHFLFGYVHPFYDGNGRTSRFISSMYLNKELSEMTAISLSRGCNKYQNEYLSSFEYANLTSNFGEMNVFIESFLTIIKKAQEITLIDLMEKSSLLDSFVVYIESEEKLERNELAKDMLFVLAQNYYFAIEDKGLTRSDFHEMYKNEKQSHIVPALNFLVENGYAETNGKSPIYYRLKKDTIE